MNRCSLPLFAIVLSLAAFSHALDAEEGRGSFEAPAGISWVRDVEFAKVGTRALRADILDFEVAPGQKRPALVYIHGGGFRAGTKDQGLSRNLPFARMGYFTITIEYRLSGEAPFPAAVEDAKAAVRWVRANADRYLVDPDRIGVWGHSAGGHLAAFVGTSGDLPEFEGTGGNPERSSRVACVVDCFGPSDFLTLADARAKIGSDRFRGLSPEEIFIGGAVSESREKARAASPLTHVTPDDPPFLILHGSEDPLVPFQQSEVLHAALVEAKVPSTLVPVVGAGHGFRSDEGERRIEAFFAMHLEGKDVEVSSAPIEDDRRRGR